MGLLTDSANKTKMTTLNSYHHVPFPVGCVTCLLVFELHIYYICVEPKGSRNDIGNLVVDLILKNVTNQIHSS